MPRPRKTIEELKRSGAWAWWSKARQARRLAEEGRAPEPKSTTPVPVVPRINAEAIAVDYANRCLSGEQVCGKLVRLAADRFLRDHQREDIRFDASAAQHVVDYVSKLGLRLLDFQTFILSAVFGFKLPTGERRHRDAYVETARKQGKTTLLAALCLYMLDSEGDGEPAPECFIGSTCKHQSADLTFRAAARLRANSDDVSTRTKAYKASIECGDGYLKPIVSTAFRLAGHNVHFLTADELSDWTSGELLDIMESGVVARRQPLIFCITTAGLERRGVGWERREHAVKVLEGTLPDDRLFAYIAVSEEGEDPLQDEACWIKSNPALDVLVQRSALRQMADKARNLFGTRPSVLCRNFNIWPQALSEKSWLDYSDLQRPGNVSIPGEENLTPLVRITNAWERLRVPTLEEIKAALAKEGVPEQNEASLLPVAFWGWIYRCAATYRLSVPCLSPRTAIMAHGKRCSRCSAPRRTSRVGPIATACRTPSGP